ncbi:MAG TPA: glycosyltransferase, partial [Thermomicrobiaceae bacterium]|nr:glycosyltransferase [Thermomicrobiaceae bacterium]
MIGTETFSPDINGAARFTQRLVWGLRRAGHQVTVVAPAKRLGSSRNVQRDPAFYGVPSLPIPGYAPYRMSVSVLARGYADRVVAKVQPDVIHIQNHFGTGRSLAAIARQRRIPLVATNHFVPENFAGHIHLPAPLKRRAIDWEWNDVAHVLNRAAVVTAPTRVAASLLRSHGLRTELRVISGGIDLSEFGGEDNVSRPPRPDSDARTCLFVGRLEPEKHVDELIRALPLARTRLDLRLVVVGDGTLLDELRNLAREQDVEPYVTFAGFVSDGALRQHYQQCDVFCMPGTAELQCLAALEAMATGRPVVAADALALPELIEPGTNGYIYHPGDVAELAERLVDCLADPDETARLGQNSHETAARHAFERT